MHSCLREFRLRAWMKDMYEPSIIPQEKLQQNNTHDFTVGLAGVYFICKIDAKLNTIDGQIVWGI